MKKAGSHFLPVFVCATVTLLGASKAFASTSQLGGDGLQAIDPSQAKMDTRKPTPPPSPNPLGKVTGAPVSGNRRPPTLPAAPNGYPYGAPGAVPTYPPQGGYAPPNTVPGYQAAPYGYNPQQQQGYQPSYPPGYVMGPAGYPVPAANPTNYAPPQGYQPQQQYQQPPTQPSYPSQSGYPTQQSGYPAQQRGSQPFATPQGYSAPKPAYGAPPQGYPNQPAYAPPPQGYPNQPAYAPPPQSYPNQPTYAPPPQSYPNQPPYQQPAYQQPAYQQPAYQQPAYQPPRSAYQQSQQPAYPSSPPAYGQPPQNNYPQQPVRTASSPAYPSEGLIPEFGKPLPAVPTSAQPIAPGGWATNVNTGPPMSPEEERVTKLEQIAFGSTYPEHEVDDRVDHLEKEVFGGKTEGPMADRLAKLETKLGGGGAFSQGSPSRVSHQLKRPS